MMTRYRADEQLPASMRLLYIALTLAVDFVTLSAIVLLLALIFNILR